MAAILLTLWLFVVDLFKSRSRLEAENLFLRSSDAIERLNAGSIEYQSTGATLFMTWFLSYLTPAYVELGQFDDAWRLIRELMTAVQTNKESRWEADLDRLAGEIALKSPE